MKHYIFFALMLFSLHLGAQCVIPITEVNKTIYVPIDEIAYVVPSGTGASIVRQAGLRQLNTVEDVDSIVSLCSPSLLKFTDGSNGKVMAVSKTFIDRIVINGNGKAVIQTKNARIAYISFEDADDLNADIIACYGEGRGEDGNGIYSGSGNVPDNTAATLVGTLTFQKAGLSYGVANTWGYLGNYTGFGANAVSGTTNADFYSGITTGSPLSALQLRTSTNRWGLENFLALNTSRLLSYNSSLTGHVVSASNGSASLSYDVSTVTKTRLYVSNGIVSAWDSITGLSTNYPIRRPVGANAFWQRNTDGTGEYRTPGQMTVTNPFGGSQTIQGTIDSLYQNSNQIIVATDSFYINDQEQPVYLVAAGDTITLPSAPEYTAGSGIAISGLGEISATDNSATNELQTLSLAGNNLTLSNGGGTVVVPSGADGNGIYSGSGSTSANTTATTVDNASFKFGQTYGSIYTFSGLKDTLGDYEYIIGEEAIPIATTFSIFGMQSKSLSNPSVKSFFGTFANKPTVGTQNQNNYAFFTTEPTGGANTQTNAVIVTTDLIKTAKHPALTSYTVIPNERPLLGSNAFWQHNIDGTGEYKTPGAMAVTNPYGGTNTIQAALDSAGVNGTWLKPELEAGDVTINSADNALILNKASMTTDPAIHVVHPVPTIGVTRRLFSAGQTSSGYAFEIAQHSDNSYKISTSQALLTLESSSLGDPTQAQLGNGEMYIVNTSGPSSIKLNATSNTVSIAASPTNAENWTLTLPTTNGSPGQFWQTDGNGVIGWATPVVPNIGGISALHTGASYSYTAQVLGDTTGNALSLSTTVGVKSGITKIITAGGHGIQASFGGTATCEVSAFVTIQGNSDWFGLQIMVNNQPVYSNVYAALPASDLWPSVSTSLSHIIDLNNNDVVTIKIMSTDANIVDVVSAGLTVKKTQ